MQTAIRYGMQWSSASTSEERLIGAGPPSEAARGDWYFRGVTSSITFPAELDREREDFARRQRSGVHFIAAAAVAWTLITVVQFVVPDLVMRNLATFVAAAILMPVAWGLSKVLGIPFSDESPLAKLGFLVSINQVFYLPIAMWAYAAAPERFVMILAIITFAHLLPFHWLYKSRIYFVLTSVGTLVSVVLGLVVAPAVVAAVGAVLVWAGAIALFVTTSGKAGASGVE